MSAENELPSLLLRQKQCLTEEKVLTQLLHRVRDEIHKAQIEQLHFDSIVIEEERKKREEAAREQSAREETARNEIAHNIGDAMSHETYPDFDPAPEQLINQQEIDLLGVSSSLSKMMEGKFFAGNDDEEEEDEEDEDEVTDPDEFILPLLY